MKIKLLMLTMLFFRVTNSNAQLYYDTIDSICPTISCNYLIVNNNGYLYHDKINTVSFSPIYKDKGYKILWDTNYVKEIKYINNQYVFKIDNWPIAFLRIKICDSNNNIHNLVYPVLYKNEKVAFLTTPKGMENSYVDLEEIMSNPIVGVFVNDSIAIDYEVVSFCLSTYSGLGDKTYFKRICLNGCKLTDEMFQLIVAIDFHAIINIENIKAKNKKTGVVINLPPIRLHCYR